MTIQTDGLSSFRRCGLASKKQRLFTVTAGIDLGDALTEVSNLLSMVRGPIFDAGMGNKALEHNAAWLVLHALESAHAVVESLVVAAQEAELGISQNGGAQ